MTVFLGGLELILGSLDLVPGLHGEDYHLLRFTSSSLALVPRLPGESYWLPGFTSWFPGFGSMVAR